METAVVASASATNGVAGLSKGELDIPLATLAAGLIASASTSGEVRGLDDTIGVVATHVGEAPSPSLQEESGKDDDTAAGFHRFGSPRFSAFLPGFGQTFGSRDSSPTATRG